MKLSIIIPVFNEERTIVPVIKSVLDVTIPHVEKEIIVVNDGSTDDSEAKILHSEIKKNIHYFAHKKNLGKGAAIKTGIQHASGEYIVIQDADTEYNPKDIVKLINALDKKYQVVYGTRLQHMPEFNGDLNKSLFVLHYLGNRILSLITSALYGTWLTDMETCYKLFPRNAVVNMPLHARGFAFEPEVTAKLLKDGYRIKEIPISTVPRDYEEGKKLKAYKDGPIALWTLFKYRFID